MFVIRTLAIAAALLTLTFTVNVWVDPYGFNGTGSARFYRDITETWVQDYKFTQVARIHPQTIVLGNSRAWRGISPASSALLKGGYNFATPSLSMQDFLDQLKYAQSCGALKTVLVVLDPNAFEGDRGRVIMRPGINYKKCEGGLLPIPVRYFKENISVQQLFASLKVLAHRTAANYTADGTDLMPSESDTQERAHAHFSENLQSYLLGGWDTVPKGRALAINTRDAQGHDSFDDLRAFFEFAVTHGIRVIVFLPPLHADLQVVMDLRGLTGDAWDLKYRVLKTAATVLARHSGDIAVYDFMTVNPLTDIPTVASTSSNAPFRSPYTDASHFLPVLGAQALSTIQKRPGEVRLTLGNFDTHKAAGLEGLAKYRSRAHFVREVATEICKAKPYLAFCGELNSLGP